MTSQTVGEAGEFGLIDLISADLGTSDYVLLGPGDDAAHIATADGTYVVSTDIMVEGKHFRRDWSSATDIGHKAAASNLSDINAMGGVATALTVAFACPAQTPIEWVRDFTRAFEEEAAKVGAHLVGGDISAADSIIISVTAMGDVERPVTRSGARPGNIVAVAGTLGLSAAGFAALSRGFRSPKVAVDAHRRPEPPYEAGPEAAAAGATAMIDISDGLLADLGHLAHSSNVSIDIWSDAFDLPEAVQTLCQALGGKDPRQYVLVGGEDYALAATFDSHANLPDGWRAIGAVGVGAGVTVDGEQWAEDSGFRHF